MICERKLKLALSSSNHFSAHSLRFAPASADVEKVPLSVQLSQVRVLDVETETVTTEDVLVLGTDGLWDVVSSLDGLKWDDWVSILPKSWGSDIDTL